MKVSRKSVYSIKLSDEEVCGVLKELRLMSLNEGPLLELYHHLLNQNEDY